ncbi:hypothetical protein HY837_06320 [archaeon]|nr:hypothetical protein [archaeon]
MAKNYSTYYSTDKEGFFKDCLEEIREGTLNDKRIEVVETDPLMAQRIFYMTNDATLGTLFVAKYKDTDLHNAAYFVSVELVKLNALKESLEFKLAEERISAPLSAYTFLEDDFFEISITGSPIAVDKNPRDRGNWDGALDNRIRAFEESGGVFL